MSKHSEPLPASHDLPAACRSATRVVDARGTLCPEPLARLRLAMRDMVEGDTACLLATDPHAEIDLEVFSTRGGHQLLECLQQAGVFHFLLRKGSPEDRPD